MEILGGNFNYQLPPGPFSLSLHMLLQPGVMSGDWVRSQKQPRGDFDEATANFINETIL